MNLWIITMIFNIFYRNVRIIKREKNQLDYLEFFEK